LDEPSVWPDSVSTSTHDAAATVGATGLLPASDMAGAFAGAGAVAGAAAFAAGVCATAGTESAATATNSAQQSVDECIGDCRKRVIILNALANTVPAA